MVKSKISRQRFISKLTGFDEKTPNERLSIINGCLSSVSMSIVNGFVAMYLLDGLHASVQEMGLLNSLPSLINLFAMSAAAVAVGRVRSRKNLCVATSSVSRSFYVWMALVPFLAIPSASAWVVWLVALTRVPQSFGDLTWQALIGDLIAPQRRSAFFSDRNRWLTLVGLAATLMTGLFLQQFNKHLLWPYQAVFLSTVIFAWFELWTLARHDESAALQNLTKSMDTRPLFQKWGSALREAISQRPFVIGALTMLLFNFGWQMAWPLYNIYQIQTAHAPALWLSMFTIANQASQIVTYRWWGRMAEKYGNVMMLALAALGMALSPVLTILSTNMFYLVMVNLFTGIPVAGTTLLLFNYLLDLSPSHKRTAFIAYYNVGLAIIGFAAPEVGIYLLQSIGIVGGMSVSAVLRASGALAFLLVGRRLAKAGRSSGMLRL